MLHSLSLYKKHQDFFHFIDDAGSESKIYTNHIHFAKPKLMNFFIIEINYNFTEQ